MSDLDTTESRYRNSAITEAYNTITEGSLTPEVALETLEGLYDDAYQHRPTVDTVDELLLLPAYTVIQSDEGAIFQRKLSNNEAWVEPGSYRTMWASEITLPATILLRG